MEKTNLQLIEDAINSQTAFSVLIEKHLKSVYIFVLKLTNNKEDSEDIVQDTFIKAWQKLHKYDEEKSFKTWLFSIAKNTAIDKLRKKKMAVFSSLDFENESFEETIADTTPLPDEIFAEKESEEKVRKALEKLPENQRLIIYLHINEDLTFEEIAEIIGKPMNTIKSQYRRGIIKLKDLLMHQNHVSPRI